MKVRANTAIIATDFTKEEYEKYAPYGAFKVTDEDGDINYVINQSTFSGLTCFSLSSNTIFEGKLAVSLIFEETAEEFTNASKPALLALKQAEYAIRDNIDKIAEDLSAVDEDIEIE